MTTIADEQLFVHAERAQGKVVVLTGGGNGIGKETALLFAKHGAKIVIGDLDVKGSEAVVNDITKAGGEATSIRCNVTNWEDQVSLFELAIARYGAVDIVLPIAGISEVGSVCQGNLDFKDGRPLPPNLGTLQVNLIGAFYTAHLALHYFKHNRSPDAWKALVFMASMSSWQGIPKGPQYSSSKHAILGLMRSLYMTIGNEHIRTAVIHPWFAATNILPLAVKIATAGIPRTPVPRIAGAIFYSATDPDPSTNGCPWTLPDDGPVFRLDKEVLTTGVYELMNRRTDRLKDFARSIQYTIATTKDLVAIFGRGAILLTLIAGAAIALKKYGFA